MTDENRPQAAIEPARTSADLAQRRLPHHPLRVALLDLLAEVGTVTSTEAAARLGHSSGLCSFHLRQLARYGLIEEAPHDHGRARPWRLRWNPADRPDDWEPTEFAVLARGLELTQRDQAPPAWSRDEAFSAVLHLTPEELHTVADALRQVLAPYQDRERHPSARPATARPVAVVSRVFPLMAVPSPTNPPPAGNDDVIRLTR